MIGPIGVFAQKIDDFENSEGILSREEINRRARELYDAYRNICPTLFNAVLATPPPSTERRILSATEELVTRSLHASIRAFEIKQERKKPDSNVRSELLYADIIADVSDLRSRVQEMKLAPPKAAVFYEHCDYIATRALEESGASPAKAGVLLGIDPAQLNPTSPDSPASPGA